MNNKKQIDEYLKTRMLMSDEIETNVRIRLADFCEFLKRYPNVTKTCEWTEDFDGNWDTGCKNTFIFIEGTPKENDAIFCPYCGGQIIEKPVETEQEDDD